MSSINRFTGDDYNDDRGGKAEELLNKVLNRAKRRAEELEPTTKKKVKESKPNKEKPKKGQRITPDGDIIHPNETPTERNARKAALKQAKKDRKAREAMEGNSGPVSSDTVQKPNNSTSEAMSSSSKSVNAQNDPSEGKKAATETEGDGVPSTTTAAEDQAPTLRDLKKSRILTHAGVSPAQRGKGKGKGRGAAAKRGADLDEDDVLDAVLPESDAPDGTADEESGRGLAKKKCAKSTLQVTHEPPMRVKDSVEAWGLSTSLARKLTEDGIEEFFPVQRAVVPTLLRASAHGCIFPRDLCVSAPTGSGKTIAYALPVVQTLSRRALPRLSAVIILPSRELAAQVYRVFCRLARQESDAKASMSTSELRHPPLRVMLCTGQIPLAEEQAMLSGHHHHHLPSGLGVPSVAGRVPHGGPPRLTALNSRPTGELDWWGCPIFAPRFSLGDQKAHGAVGEEFECCGADILVCTPTRLLEHIDNTIGFTLKHLRYLVLDEADRLLGNAYHAWVTALLRASKSEKGSVTGGFVGTQPLQRLLFSATLTDNPRKLALLGVINPILIRASAVDACGDDAANDKLAMAQDATAPMFSLPSRLTESICVVEAATRPAKLIAMLVEAFRPRPESANAEVEPHAGLCAGGKGTVLIFASSVDGTHRLCRLLQLFNAFAADGLTEGEDVAPMDEEEDDDESISGNEEGDSIGLLEADSAEAEQEKDEKEEEERYGEEEEANTDRSDPNQDAHSTDEEDADDHTSFFGGHVLEMSRLVGSQVRERTMSLARAGRVRVIVSSDHMARGIDLANVDLVINYDPPKHARTYVHRVGRTARAGRAGHAVTLVKKGQLGVFENMRKLVDSAAMLDKEATVKGPQLPRMTPRVSTVQESRHEYAAALRALSGVLSLEARNSLKLGDELPDTVTRPDADL